MKSIFLKWLIASLICLLTVGMLTSCNLPGISLEGFFNEEGPEQEEEEEKEEEKEEEEGGGNSTIPNPDSNQGGTTEELQKSPFAPSIGENGNWFIGTLDTGAKANQEPISNETCIDTITLNRSELIITYTNGAPTVIPLPAVQTPCTTCTATVSYALKCFEHTAEHKSDGNWEFTPGRGLKICNSCGSLAMTNVLQHTFDDSEIVAPTCQKEGYTNIICSTCGYFEKVNGTETEKSDHDYRPLSNTTPTASCIENVVIIYACATEGCNVGKVEQIPAKGHTVAGVLVSELKKVDGALVYGQTGIKIFSATPPVCGETVEGFYTCDVCHVNVSTKVAGDHTWGEPTYTEATCTQGRLAIRHCIANGCSGRDESVVEAPLPHAMTYTLTYDATTMQFTFSRACATCNTQTSSEFVSPVHDVENSKAPVCTVAGYDLYVYTFLENGVAQSVSCRVENAAPAGTHQFMIDGMLILPDEIAPGIFAYSSAYIGQGLYVLTNNGEVGPDRVTCGNVYDGFYECACGGVMVTVKIYNPHHLILDPTHPDNKAPSATENGTAVYVCDKEGCDHVELVEIPMG